MAWCNPPVPMRANPYHYYYHHPLPSIYSSKAATTINCSPLSPVNILRPFLLLKLNSRLGRCYATTPDPQPPSNKDTSPSSGLVTTFTRFQDTLQIFVAVLFWMSLFFWSCAWDGKNGGRPNKGSRFRK